ncbi:hypothetical protein TNCV_99231 [Trichonephila clavipes]|nr:hypothetical protein TNCV_99231 [Trichonephila clavipes]
MTREGFDFLFDNSTLVNWPASVSHTTHIEPVIHFHPNRCHPFARFRLTTGHDFLGVRLHWLDLAAGEALPFCDHARMDGDHLLQYTRLDDYPSTD